MIESDAEDGMALSRAEVMHVARLAHIGLTDDEVDRMTRELSSVIEHVGKLSELDTTGVEPTSHALVPSHVLRDDETRPSWTTERTLANAPLRSQDLFEVQAILD
jgi:aspartyl-tRNA(Asn)/glutamyl-tRNA(Gln) amidotransferase subunit C